MRALAACFLVLFCLAAPVCAAETVLVRALDDSGNLLTDNGLVVRLAGIQVPAAARGELQGLVIGRRFELARNQAAEDRYGRIVAHLTGEDGRWLQRTLLERGLAAVRTRADDRERAAEMLKLEADARTGRRGQWAGGALVVREATRMTRVPEGFAIVQGKVHHVNDRQGKLYVNFGPDWRTDFTILAEGEARQALRRAGLGGSGSSSLTIRVRGWLRYWNGPLIDVDHVEQVEILKGP